MGDIESLFVDPNLSKATHFLISQGTFFKDRKLVPAHWIKSVTEDEVDLTVSSEVLERLPSYEDEAYRWNGSPLTSHEIFPIKATMPAMIIIVSFAIALLIAVLLSKLTHRTALSSAVIFLVAGFIVGPGTLNLIRCES